MPSLPKLALCVASLALLAGCAGATGTLRARGFSPSTSTSKELSKAVQARRVALVIGVDDYNSPFFPDLRYAGSDAQELGKVLSSEEGGFERVVVLDRPEQTSRSRILEELRSISADLEREDIFVLYFSGHGTVAATPAGQPQLFRRKVRN